MKLSWTFSLLIGAICILSFGCKEETVHQPNILIIITDDQGWGDVGYNGNDIVNTPTIDQLSKQSVKFNRFYVSPVCAPTRASLLTGRYHLATGVSWVTHRREVMRKQELTIGEILKDNGYRTGLFGKWHNGKQYPHDPNGQGFDEFLGFKEGHLNNYFDVKLDHNQEEVQTQGYVPDVLTEAATEFIKSPEPYLAIVSYNTPHGPFQVPDKYFDKCKSQGLDDKTACVYGMIENIDDNVGRLLQAVERSGKSDDTIVIFMTDNGPNGYRFNGGYKGIKSHVDEGGVRVPFLIRYPKKGWDDGRVIEEMAAHIDVLPTLAVLTKSLVPDSLKFHGLSLVGLIDGSGIPTERRFFTHQVIRKFDTIPGAVRTSQF